MFNHVEIIRFLVTMGADVAAVDMDQRTPLLVAASRGCMESVNILLESSPDPKIKVGLRLKKTKYVVKL